MQKKVHKCIRGNYKGTNETLKYDHKQNIVIMRGKRLTKSMMQSAWPQDTSITLNTQKTEHK